MRLPNLNRKEVLFLTLTVIVAGFLRLYNIDQTLMFLSDQGRDAIIAKRILINHDPVFIGPVTSVGNMYLGPFYYYFMVPFLALTYPNPIGPAIGVALSNILAVVFMYIIVKKLWNVHIAAVASLLLAILPIAVQYSRFSWNPNLAIPVAILLFFSFTRWFETYKLKYVLLSALWTGIIIQLHYVTLTVFGVTAFILLSGLIKKKIALSTLTTHLGIYITTIVLLLSPLILFNIQHENLIKQQFLSFFTSNEQHIRPLSKLTRILVDIEGRLFRIVSQLITGQKHVVWDRVVTYTFFGLTLFILNKAGKKSISYINNAYVIALIWIISAVIGTAFYSSSILDHYLLYCMPIMLILLSVSLYHLWRVPKFGMIISLSIGLLIAINFTYQLQKYYWTGSGTVKYQSVMQAALPYINSSYNLTLLSELKDYRALSYRYFFETSNKSPRPEYDYTTNQQLIVIDELNTPDPTLVPIFEIKQAGPLRLVKTIDISNGPRVLIYDKTATTTGVQ